MARTSSRRKKSASKTDDALVPTQRKWEVFGLLLMAVSFLLGLALISYSPNDTRIIAGLPWWDIFSGSIDSPRNWLGIAGAKLSEALIPGLLGYPILILCGFGIAWGYVLLRQRETVYLPITTVLSMLLMLQISTLIGWFAVGDGALILGSGQVGLTLATFLKVVLGPIGSFILQIVGLAITALLMIDRDIQVSIDRLEAGAVRFREKSAEWMAKLRKDHNRRVAIRAERRAEYQKKTEEERLAREEERKTAELQQNEQPADPPAPIPLQLSERPKQTLPRASTEIPLGDSADDDSQPDDLLEELITRHSGGELSIEGDVPVRVQGPAVEPAGSLADRHSESQKSNFTFPDLDLLDSASETSMVDLDEIEENKNTLLEKLATYNIDIVDCTAVVGPTVTRYELTPAPGVRINRITALQDDLAMALAAPGIRILAPIPGKSAIGVEIANRKRELVRLSSILGTARFTESNANLPAALGKNIQGEVHIEDLSKMPHLLMAGATGAGKSVGLNAMIIGLMFSCEPRDLKFVMIDPKKIELGAYRALLNHYIAMPEGSEEPVITDFREAAGVIQTCVKEMELRYDKLAEAGVRGIVEYNDKFKKGDLLERDGHKHLPYIVVVVDELADLMMTAGKEIEPPIARLAQMARAVGIHLILATQRPSVDVITGLIKANFPSRIAYQVASRIDSRTILDVGGAEQLIGNGDLLYMNGSRINRLQGPFVSNKEIDNVVNFISRQPGPGPYQLPPLQVDGESTNGVSTDDGDRDDFFVDAARIIVRSQQGSVSLLQRKLSIGYTRAARIIDQLEAAGIVGPFEGSKARNVLVGSEMELDHLLNNAD